MADILTPPEIGAMNAALAKFRSRLDDAKAAAGWGIGDWFFDLFTFGGSPRADVRDAVLGGERLYSLLIAKRNSIVDNADAIDVHEQVLSVIEIANRAAKWDRAASLQQYRDSTNVTGEVGKEIGAQLTPDALKGYLFYLKAIVWIAIAALAVYFWSWLPKAPRGGFRFKSKRHA